jgi:hypothetical protein
MDSNVILGRFASTPEAEGSSSSGVSDHDWRKLDRLVRVAVRDTQQTESRKLRSSLHHISVQNELLKQKVKGSNEALYYKKRHKKKSKPLDLQQRE